MKQIVKMKFFYIKKTCLLVLYCLALQKKIWIYDNYHKD